jgi:hypothetical protein
MSQVSEATEGTQSPEPLKAPKAPEAPEGTKALGHGYALRESCALRTIWTFVARSFSSAAAQNTVTIP